MTAAALRDVRDLFYEEWLLVRVLGYLRSDFELGQPHSGPKDWTTSKIKWAENNWALQYSNKIII